MAVLFTRSGKVAPGRLADAVGFATKTAEHINKTVPGAKVEVAINVSGSYNEVHWVTRTESLAQFESMMQKAESDERYQAMSSEGAKDKLFIDIIDRLYRVIA